MLWLRWPWSVVRCPPPTASWCFRRWRIVCRVVVCPRGQRWCGRCGTPTTMSWWCGGWAPPIAPCGIQFPVTKRSGATNTFTTCSEQGSPSRRHRMDRSCATTARFTRCGLFGWLRGCCRRVGRGKKPWAICGRSGCSSWRLRSVRPSTPSKPCTWGPRSSTRGHWQLTRNHATSTKRRKGANEPRLTRRQWRPTWRRWPEVGRRSPKQQSQERRRFPHQFYLHTQRQQPQQQQSQQQHPRHQQHQ